jgi:5-methylcytosine-specific restriction endonuclease McrA
MSKRRRKGSKTSQSKANKKRSNWKKQIKIDQNYICPVCGKVGTDRTMDIHHCKNKSRGGGNQRSNVVAVHKTCHAWIHETYGNNYYNPCK